MQNDKAVLKDKRMRNGELQSMKKTKFKMTEIGPIPEDWEVKRLGEIASFETATIDVKSIDSEWYIGTENMVSGKAGIEKNLTSIPYRLVREYKVGDVLISNIRPYLKKIWLADRDGGCSSDVLVVRTLDSSVCLPIFLKMLLSDDLFFDFVMANAVGTKMPRGDKKVIVNYDVCLPPLAEQKAIAEALSDVDELLAAMTTLIEKKRAIKQGTMQELLGMRNCEVGAKKVPRRRLPGFSGEWIEKRLGDCVTIARGGSPRPIDAYLTSREDGLNWVKIGDVAVGAKYIERTSEKILPSGLSSTRMVYPGDFLLSNSMSFGRPYIMKIEGCIHDGWLVIQDYKDAFDTEYIYYVLGSESVTTQYQTIAAGSSVLNLNKDVIASVIVAVPPTLAEQRAIAEVLSDMDAEIEALEAKRAKYEGIKQSMMQELLTGRMRMKD